MKDILDTRFRHHAWFVYNATSKRKAIDFFASADEYKLIKRISRKRRILPVDVMYDIVIYNKKDGRSYTLSIEETEYAIKKFGEKNKYIEDEINKCDL